jgi:hypothetical protein
MRKQTTMKETKVIAVIILGSIILTLGMLPMLILGAMAGSPLLGVLALVSWTFMGVVAVDTLAEKMDK